MSEIEKNKNQKKNNKEIGKPHFKIKTGLKVKLFLFITVLIIGLLLTIYFITTRDTRIALISELRKKGGVIAEEKSKASYAKILDTATTQGPASVELITSENHSLLFVDIIRKDLHPRDVVYSYVLNTKGQTVIHSDDPERSAENKHAGKKFIFPAGVFSYISITGMKKLIFEKLPELNIKLSDIKNNKIHEIINNRLYPVLKDKALEDGKALKKEVFIQLASRALKSLVDERTELSKFLVNIRGDLTNLRLKFKNDSGAKEKLTEIRGELDALIKSGALSDVSLKEYAKASLEKLKELSAEVRESVSGVLTSINNFFAGYIAQSYTVQTEAGDEQYIDISYPIAQSIEASAKKIYGEIHIGISLRGVYYTIRDSQKKHQLIAFFDIIMGLIITFFLASYFTHPIKKIVSAMRKVGTGDLEQNVSIRNKDEIGLLASNFNEMVGGLREKEKIRSAMNKAVSKEIAEKMLEGEIKLGGEKVEVTMLFSDIRGFTAMSEKMGPEDVIIMLNEYMTEMSHIIDEHRGVIDKFVGDEIMAIYGAPVPVTDEDGNHIDAVLAVRSAVKMIKVLKELNKKRVERGQHEINIGIGLNTGEVVAGNMGSENRLNYTVLGDNVNLAARLCDKAERMMVLVSETTYEKVMDFVIAKKQPPLKVKGKEKPLNVYSIIDLK
jgi:class 3 adenylate cyclase